MSNSYFNASGTPATGGPGSSAPMRSEFANVAAGFDKLPPLTASRAVVVNAGGTGMAVTTGTFALAGNFATTGAYSTTFAQQANVTLTLPAVNGTLATLAGTESLSNKTLVTPALGTPVSGVLTNCTGLPLTTGITGTLPIANGGTGAAASTGSGNVVLATSPTIAGATFSGTTAFPGTTSVGSGGTVGIGTASQASIGLTVNAGASNDAISLLSSSNNNWRLGPNTGPGSGFGIYDATATAVRLKIDLSGNIGIGTTSPTSTLHVVGTGNFTGAVTLGSTINKVTITAPASGATLTIADGATLTATATASVAGTHTGTSSGTNTGDQTITLTGAVTGSGTGSIATTLANSGVSANTYTYATITVNAKGIITSASSGTAPATPTLKKQVFTSDGTFTCPAGTTSSTVFKFTVTGGGGGSAGTTPYYTGGAGGTSIKYASGYSEGSTIAIYVGSAGAAGADGGNSQAVSSSPAWSAQGTGGKSGASFGAGGVATGGDINIVGGSGSATSADGTLVGGSSYWGGGGGYNAATNQGAYGSGGGASRSGGVTSTNPGQVGIVVVEWELP